ncbi:hypothetical protein BSKO_12012 [Bryopsis sp. KO-2023]|nr:hypothetical protein BSKO_12012 [Bryopsis sp. KO-2023]
MLLVVDALEAVDLEEIPELDSEGRFLGKFILINVYAPAITSEKKVEERMDFKLGWYKFHFHFAYMHGPKMHKRNEHRLDMEDLVERITGLPRVQ